MPDSPLGTTFTGSVRLFDAALRLLTLQDSFRLSTVVWLRKPFSNLLPQVNLTLTQGPDGFLVPIVDTITWGELLAA